MTKVNDKSQRIDFSGKSEGAIRQEGLVNEVSQPIASEVLFGGRRELLIRHMGQDYRLRLTQLNKLILTK